MIQYKTLSCEPYFHWFLTRNCWIYSSVNQNFSLIKSPMNYFNKKQIIETCSESWISFHFHQINQLLNADIQMKTEKFNKLPILVITISRAVRSVENNKRMAFRSFAKLSIPPLNVRHHLFYVFICSFTVALIPWGNYSSFLCGSKEEKFSLTFHFCLIEGVLQHAPLSW